MSVKEGSRQASPWLLAFGIVLGIIGVVLAIGGIELASLGGSWYYLIAGVLLVAAAVQYVRARVSGAWLVAALFAGTVVWSIWEIGFAFWPSVPRILPMLVLLFFALLSMRSLGAAALRRPAGGAAVVAALGVLAFIGGMFVPHGVIDNSASLASSGPHGSPVVTADAAAGWRYYGRTPSGTRYAPFTQIDRQNVGKLEVAWTFRTGDIAGKGAEDQTTPTQVGDTVYVCTPYDKVFALDADTGKERWHFDAAPPDSQVWNRCRGVAYYDADAYYREHPQAEKPSSPLDRACPQRLFLGTVDARLIALDAKTGKPCEAFGKNGTVDLKVGMGVIKPFYYMPTSEPTVMRNMVLLGGWVQDGGNVDEPPGVVRAFSADSGELIWAWDLGNAQTTKLPPEGQSYTRTSPNVWSTPAYDDRLGLVYLPTGNQTPDFWGGWRRESSEEYSSSVVALDIATGRPRWHFQTTHHDLWDYDVPSQPALYDLPDGNGGKVPALVALTKRGQIFLLNRETGKPLAEVVEKPVPTDAAEGDRASPTQPYSVGMPGVGTEPLSEAKMWGATFFDQLWCRIEFKKMRYDGDMTLPHHGVRSLQYPGNYGGFNWGSAAIDESKGLLYVNNINMPLWTQLVTREEANAITSGREGLHVQEGAPFATRKGTFMSPLGVPCHEPPYGTMTAIDLDKRAIVWQRPMGTVADTILPSGIKVRAPVPLGMPTLGGPVSTASGLVFFAGTQDYRLRALDGRNGNILWEGKLPVGAQATPMTYISPKSGRQFVVIAAGGARQSPERGDYIVAFALPHQH